MNIITALDEIFSFIPEKELQQFKIQGLYQLILERRVKDASDLYDHLNNSQCAWPKSNYSSLARAMKPWLKPGPTLQIGSGSGELLWRLYRQGQKLLYGLDRSPAMMRLAKKKLKGLSVRLIKEKAENIRQIPLLPLKNIIIHNFWGLIPKAASIKLLLELKNKLLPQGQIIIGPFSENMTSEKRTKANRILNQELNFCFSYPQFKNFACLGYKTKTINIANLNYYLLEKP